MRRTSLLLLPLIFGMLAIVPIQAWVEARANGAFEAVLVLAGTIVGCALIHHLIVLHIRWLEPLFGVSITPSPIKSIEKRNAGV
ncbi:hypothetical protein [Wenzhouxiangella limi]|uniref:hypothetical protein n=1 Tax=Wenzhouxiangella limi TaxID=2707351 RepID=UPI001942B3DE|nr:hypothetical protein [Wenzhouxiangella limi]